MRVSHLVLADHPWPERCKGREALAQRPLRRRPLHIARADIVHDGVAEHVVHGLSRRNLIPRLADHDCQLRLVVHHGARLGQNHVIAWSYHG